MDKSLDQSNPKSRRYAYFDFIKILAAFLVIFNHLPGYTLYFESDGIKEWGYLFITMVTRANVPLFLMVSGALLLPKQENFKELLLKRVLRYVVVIIAANCLVYSVWVPGTMSGRELCLSIMKGSIQGSYWYLYAYLAMLLMLPFLRKLAANFTRQDFLYMLLLRFLIVSAVPVAEYITSRGFGFSFSLNGNFSIPVAVDKIIFYPLTGYYLDRILKVENLKKRYLLGITAAAFAGIAISSVITYHQGVTTKFTQGYVQLFDYLTAIWIFVWVKYLFTKWAQKTAGRSCMNKVLQELGGVTFGIYLFDPVLKKYLYAPMTDALERILPTVLVSFTWCFVSMVICGAVTWLLLRIKPVRKFL